MKVRREVGTVVILLLGIAIMYACTTPTPEDQTVIQEVVVTATSEEGVESEPRLVGVQAPLSGDAAQYGYWLQTGLSRFDETGDLDAGDLEMPVITIQDGQFVTWTPEG